MRINVQFDSPNTLRDDPDHLRKTVFFPLVPDDGFSALSAEVGFRDRNATKLTF